MPKIKIPEKTVALKKKTTVIILKALQKALSGSDLTEESLTEFNAGDERDRDYWWVPILSKAELLFGQNFDTQKISLPSSLPLRTSEAAHIVYRGYLSYLNKTLRAQGKNYMDTEKEEIVSRYALVHEILRRFAAVALSEHMDSTRDGEKILLAMKAFIQELKQTEVLNNNSNKLSPFSQALGISHPNWECILVDMVKSIKLLNSNNIAIEDAGDCLHEIRDVLVRRLIAELNPNKNPQSLADTWFETTLEDCEKAIIDKYKLYAYTDHSFFTPVTKTQPLSTGHVGLHNIPAYALTNQSTAIIKELDKKPQVKKFYTLRAQANVLIEVVSIVKHRFARAA